MSAGASLWVVGLPAWGEDAITSLDLVGRQALASAAVVVGGEAHLAAVDDLAGDARRVVLRADLSGLDAAVDADAPSVVVASGDPGFFGVLRALRARLEGDPRRRVRVVPAVSSVAAVFAAVGLCWDDAHVVSAHGRDPATAVAVARRSPKVAVLTSPDFGPGELADALDERPRRWLVGQQLGTAQARVTESWPGPPQGPFAEPNIVGLIAVDEPDGELAGDRAVLAPPASGGWRAHAGLAGWGLADDAFAHRDGQLTKAEVRAVALAWLGPAHGDLVWDVGCGSGSVAVECAALGAAVCAVDRDADQIETTRANAARHGVPVDAHLGQAPAALADLPQPDAVFVGGGGADVAAIAAAAAGRARRAVVVALAAVERVGAVWAALAEAGCEVDGAQIAASRLMALPGGGQGAPGDAQGAPGGAHRLAALNPVTLLRGVSP